MLKFEISTLTKTLPIAVALLVILVLVGPFLADYYLSVLRNALLWLGLAVSWHFFSGSTRYISLGSAAFFGIGLYFAATSIGSGLPLLVIVFFAGLLCFALALAVGLVTLRLRGIYFAILTFSVSMVVMSVAEWYEAAIVGTKGIYVPIPFDSITCYYAVLVCTIMILLVTTLVRWSKFGLALKMIGENEEAAVHVGVNASMYKTLGFAISSMLMGFMGATWVTRLAYINTGLAFDPLYSFLPPVMTMLGGLGSVYGPIIGSVALSLIRDILSVTLVYYFLIALGLILIAIVMLMPNGIMGILGRIEVKPSGGKKSGGKKSGSRKKVAKAPEMPP